METPACGLGRHVHRGIHAIDQCLKYCYTAFIVPSVTKLLSHPQRFPKKVSGGTFFYINYLKTKISLNYNIKQQCTWKEKNKYLADEKFSL